MQVEAKPIFKAKAWSIGPSIAIVIPKHLRELLNIERGDEVTVVIVDIKKIKKE